MAKGSPSSRRGLALGLLFLPLLYAAILRCNFSPSLHLWKLQVSSRLTSGSSSTIDLRRRNDTAELSKFLLRRLVRGSARRELIHNGITCISDTESDMCITTAAARLTTGSVGTTVLHLTAGQRLPPNSTAAAVRPYPRKTDPFAMSRTSPVAILPSPAAPPPCDFTHRSPALIFSTGGFAGNFFHDVNDVLLPLFLTSSPLRPRLRLRLVATDFEPYWADKYSRLLSSLSSSPLIVASSPSLPPLRPQVHCFPSAVVGLKYHGNLLANSSLPPGRLSTLHFRHFLHRSLSLDSTLLATTTETTSPTLLLLSRRKSRMLLNEEAVAQLAQTLGFHVILATPEEMKNVEEFAQAVYKCDVMLGVHGAGLTNLVFMRPGAVMVQVVPWGLDWAALAYYGRPAMRLGLRYVEYHVEVEESTLADRYPRDHPVLADPWGINLQGYNVSRPVYTDGQDVRVNLGRFRETLVEARRLVSGKSDV